MTEYQGEEGPVLSDKDREYLEAMHQNLQAAIAACHSPLDSMVLGHLEMAADLIHRQLELDMYHEWGPAMELDAALAKNDGQKFLFLDNDNDDDDAIPTADELGDWFDT